MTVEPFDPKHCPLCGADNRCAIERGASIDTCWCASTAIATHIVDAIPAAARDRACVCPLCAAKGLTDAGHLSA